MNRLIGFSQLSEGMRYPLFQSEIPYRGHDPLVETVEDRIAIWQRADSKLAKYRKEKFPDEKPGISDELKTGIKGHWQGLVNAIKVRDETIAKKKAEEADFYRRIARLDNQNE